MMRLLLLFLCTIIYNFSNAQGKLILCTNYDNEGKYAGVLDNIYINKSGNFMYLFYEATSPINDTLYIKIEKNFNRKDSNYYQFDHYYLVPDASKKWAVNKYIFTKPGNYKISTFNRNGVEIAKPSFAKFSFEDNEYDDLLIKDSWYYKKSKITFYEKSVGDSLVGENDIFNYQPSETKILLKIAQENQKPLNTNNLFVSIYTDDKNHEFISSDSYYVNENWWWTFIPIYLKNKGKYIVEVYTNNDIFIQHKKVEIK